MKIRINISFFTLLGLFALFQTNLGVSAEIAKGDPLPSWNSGAAKSSIISFVERVTLQKSKEFVPSEERVAVFDNDGTLWTEYPFYNQLAFAIDRVNELAPAHPEWRDEEPFRSILAGNLEQALAGGTQAAASLVTATHANMDYQAFAVLVQKWIGLALHPRYQRHYTACIYQPMLEVLAYLKRSDFKVYIVSGGGSDFMRPWTEKTYGIPPERVIGSRIALEFAMTDTGPTLNRLPEISFIDDGPGKPIAIHQIIGRRPIAAFGNSDGDMQMLQWTTGGERPSLGLIVHHTDEMREYAYDRQSKIGKLDKALDAAPENGWIVVDMKEDWARIFPFD